MHRRHHQTIFVVIAAISMIAVCESTAAAQGRGRGGGHSPAGSGSAAPRESFGGGSPGNFGGRAMRDDFAPQAEPLPRRADLEHRPPASDRAVERRGEVDPYLHDKRAAQAQHLREVSERNGNQRLGETANRLESRPVPGALPRGDDAAPNKPTWGSRLRRLWPFGR